MSFYAPQQTIKTQVRTGLLTVAIANTGEQPVFIDDVSLRIDGHRTISPVPLGDQHQLPTKFEPGAWIYHVWSPDGEARRDLDQVQENTQAWLEVRMQSGQVVNSQRFPIIHETTSVDALW